MQPNYFLDTNIFIYVHDSSDSIKTAKARSLVAEAYASNRGVISEQVVREFCNVAVTKFATQMSKDDIIATIETELKALLPTSSREQVQLFEIALRLRDRYSLSFYDALIVQAALDSDCKVLYSEDMQDGAHYGQLKVINPFS